MHRPGLADPVRPVNGLRLDGRIPPGVEHENVVGFGEREARTAGFQADEEHRGGARAELVDDGAAVSCLAVQIRRAHARRPDSCQFGALFWLEVGEDFGGVTGWWCGC